MSPRAATAPLSHNAVWLLLPWHAAGTLASDEASAVSAHLASCPPCQQELERCQHLAKAVQIHEVWAPGPTDVQRVMARIDAAEAAQSISPWRQWWRGTRARLAELGAELAGGPPAVRWALAGQAVLIVALASTLAWNASTSGAPYRTLSNPPAPAPAAPAMRLVFAAETTEAEMRALLDGLRASIVAGPSPAGVYTVALASGDAASLTRALETARAHPRVRMAEPASR